MEKANYSSKMLNNWRGNGYADRNSPYLGVYRISENRKWEARIDREGLPTMHLGIYYTAEDAARAYDIVSIKLKGWDAVTNFDLNKYNVARIMESEITQAMDGTVSLQKVGSNDETRAYPQSSSLVQHNPQQLSNSSFSHGFQNPNLISSNPYTLGGFTGDAGSSGGGSSIGNHGGEFPNLSATLQQPLQTQSQVNVNNVFNQKLFNNNNNQFLPQSSNLFNFPLLARGTKNLEIEKCLRLTDWPADFGKKLLGGNLELEPLSNLNVQSLTHGMVNQSTFGSQIQPAVEPSNGVCSFGSQIQPVAPSNQEFGAIQLPLPEVNQSYEPFNYNANTSNQIPVPHQNLNSSFSDSFQNPISEPNNNGSQGQTSGGQFDLDMRDYLNILEDNDSGFDFDMFAAMNGGRQGL